MKLSFAFDWVGQFEELDSRVRKQIIAKLKEIDRVHSWPHEAFKGRQFKGLFKIRVRDYRLIYRLVDGTTMDFLYLGHRRDTYN